jgi:hypothetical protein
LGRLGRYGRQTHTDVFMFKNVPVKQKTKRFNPDEISATEI